MEETQAQQLPKIRVSAIVVSHNSALALRRSLAALERSQERESLEILVVDCGSRDESPQLDAEFPSAQILRMPRHFGYTRARNVGIRTAAGEYLFLLDAGVEVAPGTAAALARRLDADTDAAAVCPLLTDAGGSWLPQVFYLPTPRMLARAWREGGLAPVANIDLEAENVPVEHASMAALMVRTYFVKGINCLDQRFPHAWSDIDLSFQIWRSSKKTRLVPSIRVVSHPDVYRPELTSNSTRALVSADFGLGAVSFAFKYFGFLKGLRLRLLLTLESFGQALAAMLRARAIGYSLARFGYILTGQRIDGTQREM